VAAGVLGAAWVLLGTLRFVVSRLRSQSSSNRFTAEMLGMTLAHFGIAVFLVGALLTEGLALQRELAVTPGQTVDVGRYSFRFEGAQHSQGPNYQADRGTVTVFEDDRPLTVMHPEKRAYASGGQVMTEAAIEPGFTRDLYVALGEPLGGGSWALRVHVKPFVRWIWAGALLMMLGGLVAATDRRFRRVTAASPVPSPAPSPVPEPAR
jgi:cytochrome c-type biogenesis protein CcmF